jgi:hypothetical protein
MVEDRDIKQLTLNEEREEHRPAPTKQQSPLELLTGRDKRHVFLRRG